MKLLIINAVKVSNAVIKGIFDGRLIDYSDGKFSYLVTYSMKVSHTVTASTLHLVKTQ